jgi:hypothetical protein
VGTAIEDLLVDWRGGIYPAKAFYSEANGSPTFLIDAPSYFHRDRSTAIGKTTSASRSSIMPRWFC